MTNTVASTNLANFFRAAANTTTRERIFFNRLSFDLTIAAARAGYHLHLYEPDVDRDGFDIVVEDSDSTRQIQTKAVLSGVGTNRWNITAGLLRPSSLDSVTYGWSLVEGGRAGGIVLIEIDASADKGQVAYSYTDYEILIAIAYGYLFETSTSKRGKAAVTARQDAAKALKEVWEVERNEKVSLSRRLFVRLTDPDQLLGLIGMASNWDGFDRYHVKKAFVEGVDIDDAGKLVSPTNDTVAALKVHIDALVKAQPEALSARGSTIFKTFDCDIGKG